MTRGYRSWFQDLINVWTMAATMLKNKVICKKFFHSVAFVNEKCCACLRPLYIYFPDTPRTIRPLLILLLDVDGRVDGQTGRI
jgi:hypothetical protein